MTSKIYEYGLLPPTYNADRVDHQIRAGHRYRNVLIEIERERRAKVREILVGHADTEPLAAEVVRLTAELEAARQRLKLARATTRSRSDSAGDRLAVREIVTRLKVARTTLKEAKTRIAGDPEIQAKLIAAQEHAHQRQLAERARTEAYYGTYLLAEAAAEQASKSKTDPSFAPYRGEGRIGVLIINGIGVAELTDDTRIQIHARDNGRGGRRAGQGRMLRLRVGSDERRGPIWAEWPMILHRPLPEGARIKQATVIRRRRDCRRWDWRVQILLDLSASPSRTTTPADGACALNLGWAHMRDGIRAGYVIGTDGREHEVAVSRSVIDRLDKADSIRSIRDRDLNTMRAALAAWIAEHPLPTLAPQPTSGDGRTASLAERADHLYQWRSPSRFATLARCWRMHRFDGDSAGYELLEAWRYRDEHLQRYEAGLVRGAQLARREGYRVLAAQLAARYRVLVVDDTDLRDLQRSPMPESERTEIDAAKLAQCRAAGSELRAALSNAFGVTRVVKVSAKNVTATCHACGSIEKWDRAASGRKHLCASCGVTWDQDANACRNLLREFEVRERQRVADHADGARMAEVTAPLRESRWSRKKREKRERTEAGCSNPTT